MEWKAMYVFYLVLLVLLTTAGLSPVLAAEEANGPWRSSLYPEDWAPGYADAEGRFLQDFSFAGYHYGTKDLPVGMLDPVVDVTAPPYNADNTGNADVTDLIQQALDSVGENGGGTVYLPAGTYKLMPKANQAAFLVMRYSNVRLMGAGPEKTFIKIDSYETRHKWIIHMVGQGSWSGISSQKISKDLTGPTQVIPLDGTPDFEVGDWVNINYTVTEEWLAEHNIQDTWKVGGTAGQVRIIRKVIAVDATNNTITIDIPTRYAYLVRDEAKVSKISYNPLEEVGVSDFSVGMLEHPGDGWDNPDYNTPGKAAYDVNLCTIVRTDSVTNSWIRNIHTYKLPGNKEYYIHSNGIWLNESRLMTVADNDIRYPQSHTGGTDGYLYFLRGADNLVINNVAYDGRHNYTFEMGAATGNVLTGNFSHNERPENPKGGMQGLASDFHMHFSVSNLVENMTLDGDMLHSGWRGDGHALTTSNSVLWNTNGLSYGSRYAGRIITSEQSGWGYVIGTRGPASKVSIGSNSRTLPVDFVEGIGEADRLEPQSLYFDQLKRRLEREGVIDNAYLDFRPEATRISILSPKSGTVARTVPIDLEVSVPDDHTLNSVLVYVDNKLVFEGKAAPQGLTLDTVNMEEGRHEVYVVAATDEGRATLKRAFNVNNWWDSADYLEPPLDSGWFGTVDRSRTSSVSGGWGYDTENKEAFFDDADRKVRQEDTTEFLVWEAPNLARFSLDLFVKDQAAVDAVKIEASVDGESWTRIAYSTEATGPSAAGWYKLSLVGSCDPTDGNQWLRVTVQAGVVAGRDLQLGQLQWRGLNPVQ